MNRSGTIAVAGGGVFGLACALALVERGLPVALFDPPTSSPSASAVAAGLLAPVGEAVFDPVAAGHYPLMTQALSLWPAFAQRHGLDMIQSGLRLVGDHQPALRAIGVDFSSVGRDAFVSSEALVANPANALSTLRDRLASRGGEIQPRPFQPEDRTGFKAVVLATGPGGGAAPELRRLTPVKGQIAILPHGPADGPVVRWMGGYLAPQQGGARLGATMEVGVGDRRIDPAAIQALIEGGMAHVPKLDVRDAYGEAAVRVQSPDGLPLVGPSVLPQTLLAAGARRNGWLFAPLVGAMIAAYCMGEDPGPWADALHPGRFEKS